MHKFIVICGLALPSVAWLWANPRSAEDADGRVGAACYTLTGDGCITNGKVVSPRPCDGSCPEICGSRQVLQIVQGPGGSLQTSFCGTVEDHLVARDSTCPTCPGARDPRHCEDAPYGGGQTGCASAQCPCTEGGVYVPNPRCCTCGAQGGQTTCECDVGGLPPGGGQVSCGCGGDTRPCADPGAAGCCTSWTPQDELTGDGC